jgi:hypothetical protein
LLIGKPGLSRISKIHPHYFAQRRGAVKKNCLKASQASREFPKYTLFISRNDAEPQRKIAYWQVRPLEYFQNTPFLFRATTQSRKEKLLIGKSGLSSISKIHPFYFAQRRRAAKKNCLLASQAPRVFPKYTLFISRNDAEPQRKIAYWQVRHLQPLMPLQPF